MESRQPRLSRITVFLEGAPAAVFVVYAMTAAFLTYFCMYAFRKPFAAGLYEGLHFFGTQIELKTAFVISQIIGYTLSKYLGVKICPEIERGRRARLLVVLILLAELALLLFAVLPTNLKVLAILLNGLPLGMVWGLVVWYMEGRRTSEILLSVLCCSYIISSGVVKGVGLALMDGLELGALLRLPPVPEFWMPAVTGALFSGPFLLCVWLLDKVPNPTQADVMQRSARKTMTVGDRVDFLRRYLPGIVMLVAAYTILTAFRDFRDNYQVDVLTELGYGKERILAISSSEITVAFGVMAVMATVFFFRDNRRALLAIFTITAGGLLLISLATLLRRYGVIDGYWWMLLIGLGAYLGYVPYNSLLFDRLMASTRAVGTAVFAMYIADALGYTGSVFIQIFNDLVTTDMSRLQFLEALSVVVSLGGAVLVIGGGFYFLRLPRKQADVQPSPVIEAEGSL